MKTKKLYHGTKCKDVESVVNTPLMQQSANGYGLYLTDSEHIATHYGEVIVFEVPYDFEVDIVRPMDNYEDTVYDGRLEYIINTQATYVNFLKSMEDAYHEPFAIPF